MALVLLVKYLDLAQDQNSEMFVEKKITKSQYVQTL
jgi:hypothetical protein